MKVPGFLASLLRASFIVDHVRRKSAIVVQADVTFAGAKVINGSWEFDFNDPTGMIGPPQLAVIVESGRVKFEIAGVVLSESKRG